VGAYNIETAPGKDKTKFSITSKGKMYNDQNSKPVPASNHYTPNFRSV